MNLSKPHREVLEKMGEGSIIINDNLNQGLFLLADVNAPVTATFEAISTEDVEFLREAGFLKKAFIQKTVLQSDIELEITTLGLQAIGKDK